MIVLDDQLSTFETPQKQMYSAVPDPLNWPLNFLCLRSNQRLQVLPLRYILFSQNYE